MFQCHVSFQGSNPQKFLADLQNFIRLKFSLLQPKERLHGEWCPRFEVSMTGGRGGATEIDGAVSGKFG